MVGDDELVVDRRAVDDEGVGAVAAVDRHRRVLHVLVAVRALATEQARQVADLVRPVGVLLQRQEGVDDEGVVVVATGEVERGDVVVDLELVVLRLAKHIQREAVAVAHVLHIGNRHALGVFEVLVALVRDLRHGADDDVVVTPAHLDHGQHRRVVDKDRIIAIASADRHAFDVRKQHRVAQRVQAANGVLQATCHVKQLVPELGGIAVADAVDVDGPDRASHHRTGQANARAIAAL